MLKLFPKKRGLYRPEAEHDACGVGCVANIKNEPSHQILLDGLQILCNVEHRGGVGANPTTGDGAGLLIQLPDAFFRTQISGLPTAIAGENAYGVGFLFLPQNKALREGVVAVVEAVLRESALPVIAWREVPINLNAINAHVTSCAPYIAQVFIGVGEGEVGEPFERRLFIARKIIENRVANELDLSEDAGGFYAVSMSSRTIVYKGMFMPEQLIDFYLDLADKNVKTALAVVHQRYSTNTFPAWSLAHPFRMIAHNGEINTLRGNINNMLARHHSIESPLLGDDLEKIWPLIREGQSDTASLDNALELLLMSGYSLPHALSVLIPEAWESNQQLSPQLRDFYSYHAPMMEPWDGPAGVVFTNGKQIGAVLDRNGLRPGRYWLTDDDRFIFASESGVLAVADNRILSKWRVQPGRILLLDLQQGRIIDNDEVKATLAAQAPYGEWVKCSQLPLAVGEEAAAPQPTLSAEALLTQQQRFGYTQEDIKFILRPMVLEAAEPIGSMGDDTPQPVLSARMKPLSSYFRQEFAQVTNPPIDPIREGLVMSTTAFIGARPNLLNPLEPPKTTCVSVPTPILTKAMFAAIAGNESLAVCKIDISFDENSTLAVALQSIKDKVIAAVAGGAHLLILSDANAATARVVPPMLLVASAVHHALVRSGDRTQTGIIVETGAVRSVHEAAVLIGYGVDAIYPYLAYETIMAMPLLDKSAQLTAQERVENYRKALAKGLMKVMSKMGISTVMSYCGAQIFEAIGLAPELIDECFCGTVSQIGGIGVADIEQESRFWHEVSKNKNHPLYQSALDAGGDYAYRIRGEQHGWTPTSIAALQHSVRTNNFAKFSEFSEHINNQNERLMTLRGLLAIKQSATPVPLEEVEPATDIVCRFSTGAMSFGSISMEAHTTLAIAMNRIGGRSNTGEGGEEASRFVPLANGDSARSSIKQVASGRFGVTAEYLANSDMMQIKIAQGAKPGEGGQLPGHKVDKMIGSVRHSVPGVGLISPPPHHDIYSIEDIAQLIYDLKCANPNGEVSVKLVSRDGVGTVAAGVAKGKSDHITISGYDGGTGASPLSSIKHAGTPWELGLAETQQTLVLNNLRGRIKLQVDGQIKTGRDVVVGALLGADEFGFATAPLVAEGCLMMRKCHLNTCPVGIATQDPRLRKKFAGKPEHVVNYFFFVAEEIRQLLASMGYRRLQDIIGRADLLQPINHKHWKTKDINLLPLLEPCPSDNAKHHCEKQQHDLPNKALDYRWLKQVMPAIENKQPIRIEETISNKHRTVGTITSNAIARLYGHAGLPDNTIAINLSGVAGQSFGAFVSRGITLHLKGEANDYFGKGLSGGILAVQPPTDGRDDGKNIIVGNTALYGGICGEAYCRGVAGERFAVRNSGVHAVVEAVGDHGCEYMTGGTVVVIGSVGRNFAGGMSGGVAYVLDENNNFTQMCNPEMVDLRQLGNETVLHRDATDEENLLYFLGRHYQLTGSAKAKTILDNLSDYKNKFVKVMPRDYEQALLKQTKISA